MTSTTLAHRGYDLFLRGELDELQQFLTSLEVADCENLVRSLTQQLVRDVHSNELNQFLADVLKLEKLTRLQLRTLLDYINLSCENYEEAVTALLSHPRAGETLVRELSEEARYSFADVDKIHTLATQAGWYYPTGWELAKASRDDHRTVADAALRTAHILSEELLCDSPVVCASVRALAVGWTRSLDTLVATARAISA